MGEQSNKQTKKTTNQKKKAKTKKNKEGVFGQKSYYWGSFYWNLSFPPLQSIYIPLNHQFWINLANKLQMQKLSTIWYSSFY